MYVSGLARYLQKAGHHVSIVAGMPPEAFNDHPLFYSDEALKTILYRHEATDIIGVVLNNETTSEIYSKYRREWVSSWKNILDQYPITQWDILHMHSITSATGEALMEATKKYSPGLKILASYHVPVSCVKGTLMYGGGLRNCTVVPGVVTCTACVLSEKKSLPLRVTKIIAALMPELPGGYMPTGLRMKWLIKNFLQSFKSFDHYVNHWHVFSKQVYTVLAKAGVAENKIALLRHGVSPVFFKEKAQANEQKCIFLYASRFEKVKGFETLLKAWHQLPEDNSRALWMVGNNQTDDKNVADLIRQFGQRADIKWIAPVNQQGLADLMSQAHCVIIPSEWMEIGPLIFHEALAARCNVIASDIGGCRELSAYYTTPAISLFKAGDEEELSSAIAQFNYHKTTERPFLQDDNYAQVLLSYDNIEALPL